jgi:hypothetical protein
VINYLGILRFALLISAFRTNNFNSLCSSPLSARIKTRIHDNPFDDHRHIRIRYTTLSITEIVDYLSKNGTCDNIFEIDFISKSLVDLDETDSKVFTVINPY